LLAQDLAPTIYEVIVVDDAVCEETRQLVECWARKARVCGHTIRYIAVTGSHGPAAARNRGWCAAQGEVIAFTDDDCIPSPDWLRAGMAAMCDGIVGVAGRLIMPIPAIPTDYEYNATVLTACDFVTANCFYRKAALEAVGGFDERFAAAWREDSDLIFTLRERGASVTCAPDAMVVHPVRPASWGVSIKQQRKSLFNALLYKKHPVLYRQYIQAAPPWPYYAIIGALLVALMGVSRRSGILTLVGLGLWTWLTGRFCMQRLRYTSHAPRHVIEMMITSVAIPPLAIFWRLRGALKFRVFFL
jgi:cellulose synthase/poly-beta-1,6-N-acetylglucosamine synthase-like glycosyltransferase